MKLPVIYEEKPKRWGFRGDSYFWDHLKARAENMDVIYPDEPEAMNKAFVPAGGKPWQRNF